MSSPDLPILHVDMDAFFVEVERLTKPELINQAVIVGGASGRGVVASASYEARAKGVRAGMPSVRAKRVCPEAVFIAPSFEKYLAAARNIRQVFESFTPLVENISLDEAFLDVSGAHALFGTSEKIAWSIKSDVYDATKLHCSVGVATNKTLAKLSSVAAKPQIVKGGLKPGVGVCVLPVAEQLQFLHALPAAAVWGVGQATTARLDEMGITTVGDIAATPVEALVAVLGKAQGTALARLAQGIDEDPVVTERQAKSLGHEETYGTDLFDLAEMRSYLTRLADAVAWRLRQNGLAGRAVELKVKFSDFSIKTRSAPLPDEEFDLDTAERIAHSATALLEQLAQDAPADLQKGVRLLGVSVSQLRSSCEASAGTRGSFQLVLPFDEPSWSDDWGLDATGLDAADVRFQTRLVAGVRKSEELKERQKHAYATLVEHKLAAAVDDIRERFGGSAIGLGSLTGPSNRPVNPSSV